MSPHLELGRMSPYLELKCAEQKLLEAAEEYAWSVKNKKAGREGWDDDEIASCTKVFLEYAMRWSFMVDQLTRRDSMENK